MVHMQHPLPQDFHSSLWGLFFVLLQPTCTPPTPSESLHGKDRIPLALSQSPSQLYLLAHPIPLSHTLICRSMAKLCHSRIFSSDPEMATERNEWNNYPTKTGSHINTWKSQASQAQMPRHQHKTQTLTTKTISCHQNLVPHFSRPLEMQYSWSIRQRLQRSDHEYV